MGSLLVGNVGALAAAPATLMELKELGETVAEIITTCKDLNDDLAQTADQLTLLADIVSKLNKTLHEAGVMIAAMNGAKDGTEYSPLTLAAR